MVIGLSEHLGDIVAAEPLIHALKSKEPRLEIIWIVQHDYRSLLENHPGIDQVISIHCLSDWVRLKPLIPALTVLDLHVPGKACAKENLRVAPNENALQLNVNNYYEHGPLLHIFCGLANLPSFDAQPELHLADSSCNSIAKLELPQKFISIHTLSSSADRDWTAEKWAEFVQRVMDQTGLPCVEIGMKSVFAGKKITGLLSFAGTLDIVQTIEVIRRSEAFVGIDSGPAHLANALEKPGVILLGAFGSFTKYLPYTGHFSRSPRVKIIQHPLPASDIAVQVVLEAFFEVLTDRTLSSQKTTQPSYE